MSGRLIAVVGPSGVGKDSVMQGIAQAGPGIGLVRRVITRDPQAGGEDCLAVPPERFETMRQAGAFCLHWQAHGLHYGIPADLRAQVAAGAVLLVNLSRAVLSEAQRLFPGLLVLELTAAPEVLAGRLAGRGRENEKDIAERLARADFALPEGVCSVTLDNGGALADTVARALALIDLAQSQPVRA
ncbi:phosphonate metabolism protein/1,5-bisphosphokinase (PRPP-forming) PhnN [Sagittula salina]|uniref:Ribose 1,5-bisphosphate phosphokinase PhnN n=1 Tax=Sagittula salina TaxID=2820268 RepID=A0A940MS74_9RHOB|nr:phosphonate metabolism protein/1,5-bisphosphokinase (PRPP-forming) PhnN [Sagittula salina]MBP0484434.1 phosphonate metabolism protein/1,5-bisphosphokinase (PRPP-forming) PhnN [Sagittula salina]